MQQLDGILWCDRDKAQILGYKDVTHNEFWIRGHIPGRPLMPGVVMIECAAQLLSFFVKKCYAETAFLGFGGIDSAKFRSVVEPGARLYLLGHITEVKSRKYTCSVQGVVNGTIVFEGVIIGMRIQN
jgi:3-hydroxyacyl-[acyl-carrier-protein] dehydratase